MDIEFQEINKNGKTAVLKITEANTVDSAFALVKVFLGEAAPSSESTNVIHIYNFESNEWKVFCDIDMDNTEPEKVYEKVLEILEPIQKRLLQ